MRVKAGASSLSRSSRSSHPALASGAAVGGSKESVGSEKRTKHHYGRHSSHLLRSPKEMNGWRPRWFQDTAPATHPSLNWGRK